MTVTSEAALLAFGVRLVHAGGERAAAAAVYGVASREHQAAGDREEALLAEFAEAVRVLVAEAHGPLDDCNTT